MYLKAVENIRAVFPDAALTTDVLTGFPGETEEEYQQTREFIRKVGYARIHVFPYSRREDTPAAVMPGQLTAAEKERRARELIALGNEVAASWLSSMTGKESVVIPEEEIDGIWYGYTPEYIRVAIPQSSSVENGRPVRVRLLEVSGSQMTAEVIE